MDELSQKKFDKLVHPDMDTSGLTVHDIAFLKARRSYLTGEQAEKLKKVFKKDFEEEEKPVSPDASAENHPSVKEDKEKEEIATLDQLKKRGAQVGLTYKIGTKKKDFKKAVLKGEKRIADAQAKLEKEADEKAKKKKK